jgi:hypothetical protein
MHIWLIGGHIRHMVVIVIIISIDCTVERTYASCRQGTTVTTMSDTYMGFIWRLPTDVLLIVYRYVFDSNYGRLIQQYKAVWLNDYYLGVREGMIFWTDMHQSFMVVVVRGQLVTSAMVANWRIFHGGSVRRLYDRTNVCELPRGYLTRYW